MGRRIVRCLVIAGAVTGVCAVFSGVTTIIIYPEINFWELIIRTWRVPVVTFLAMFIWMLFGSTYSAYSKK
jgi:hypothetical protein